MAGVDKFGAAFAVAFMAAMLGIMGSMSSDDSFLENSEQDASVPTQTYSPPVQQAAPEPTTPEPVVSPPERESLTGFLKYTIRGGVVDSISNNTDENSVTVLLDNNQDGELTITMTKDAITAFDDGTYFVTIDGEETHDFVQNGQRLTIEFMAGAEEIMIFGENMRHDDHEVMMAEKAAAEAAAAEKAAAEAAAAEAAAAPMNVEVYPVTGSGAPGCEPECYDPSTVTISAGGTVTFVNSDMAPHTATSGSATDGPDGVFDTALIMNSASFSVTLDNPGTYDYFCMVHPWMEGTVIVE